MVGTDGGDRPRVGTDPGWGQTPGGDRPRGGENPVAMGHDPGWGQTPGGDRPRVGSVPVSRPRKPSDGRSLARRPASSAAWRIETPLKDQLDQPPSALDRQRRVSIRFCFVAVVFDD